MLFDREQDKYSWEPPPPPDALGELLDSRHMLPVYLPSDPRFLGAVPGRKPFMEDDKRNSDPNVMEGRAPSRASQGARGAVEWRLQSGKLREVGIRTLQWIDGPSSAARWFRATDPEAEEDEDEDEEQPLPPYTPDDPELTPEGSLKITTHLTPLTRTRSARTRGKAASADATPVQADITR